MTNSSKPLFFNCFFFLYLIQMLAASRVLSGLYETFQHPTRYCIDNVAFTCYHLLCGF